jgi:DeoR/GlpR family transcriptional regulator of sugar metabolism
MARRSPLPEERRSRILDCLAQQGIASLAELQAAAGGSEATTRRDLERLTREGLIERTRGGARLLRQSSSLDEEFGRRRRRNARAKRLIAERAADLVAQGASLFLNDGSTAMALAQELSRRELSVWVATSGLNIAELLARDPAREVVVIGGLLRQSSFGTIGPLATAAIGMLHADLAFLGCDGLDPAAGVRSNSLYDAEVGRAMATHADRVVVIADASKWGRPARARVTGWDAVSDLVIDTLPERHVTALERQGVRVHLAAKPRS